MNTKNLFSKVYKQVNDIEESEAPTNVTGASVSTNVPVPLLKPKKFAGMPVFEVSPDKYTACTNGKAKYHRYSKYVGDDHVGESIRQFGRANPAQPIIVKNTATGAMMYLKKPKPSKVREEFEDQYGEYLEE